MMRTIGTPAFLMLMTILLVFVGVQSAYAEALVVVEVRTAEGQAKDGIVTLQRRGDDAPSLQCTTQDGNCNIDQVPGGRYIVSFEPQEGSAPAPRNVTIPPSGRVTLHVSAN